MFVLTINASASDAVIVGVSEIFLCTPLPEVILHISGEEDLLAFILSEQFLFAFAFLEELILWNFSVNIKGKVFLTLPCLKYIWNNKRNY